LRVETCVPLKVTAGRRCFSSACELTRAAECLHEGLFPRQTCERWSIQDVYDNRILNGPCSWFRSNFFLHGILNPKVSDGHSVMNYTSVTLLPTPLPYALKYEICIDFVCTECVNFSLTWCHLFNYNIFFI